MLPVTCNNCHIIYGCLYFLDTQVLESANFRQVPPENDTEVPISQQPISQVIVNTSSEQTSQNVFYIHQVVFDSATQTLREVNDIHNISDPQLVQVQMSTETTHISPVVSVQASEGQIVQNF